MKIIEEIHIRQLDPTLLIVFDRLLASRNMSAVAREMGLTQSAISHAVGRLRTIFDDPLFTRRGSGVEPTIQALRLGRPLAEALAGVRDAVRFGRRFDPATTGREFTVAAPDSLIAELAPTILDTFAGAAPRCRLIFRTLGSAPSVTAVAKGEVDLAFGAFGEAPDGTVLTPVAAQTYSVASKADHPQIGETLDLTTYCRLNHLLVSHENNAKGVVDDVLAERGLSRRVALALPNMLSAFAAVSRSEAIFTAPTSACVHAASIFGLRLHTPPLPIPGFQLGLIRRRDALSDPGHLWLEALLLGPLRSVA
jgi:DNA-binding transcriptional LysR family regulator